MAKVLRNGQMVRSMKETGKMDLRMDKESIPNKIVKLSISENGSMVLNMGKAIRYLKTEQNMMEIGR